jgi:hypothetical protein
MAQQEKSGTQAFAATTKQVACDFGDGLVRGGALAGQFQLNLNKVFPHKLKNFFDRK